MRVLDLYCGGGGSCRGLMDLGFDVTGVDIVNQPRYPGHFIQGDVLCLDPSWVSSFDFIWSSPPCQVHSRLSKGTWKTREGGHLNLIPHTRELLLASGRSFCIENVQGAPLRHDVLLCGQMFGLPLIRHRAIEIHGFPPPTILHPKHSGRVFYVSGHTGGKSTRDDHLGHRGTAAEWRAAMQIDWLPTRELVQAVPPAYSRAIGLAYLKASENHEHKQ